MYVIKHNLYLSVITTLNVSVIKKNFSQKSEIKIDEDTKGLTLVS